MRDRLRYTLLLAPLFILLLQLPAQAQWRKIAAHSTTFFNEVFFISSTHGWLTGHSRTVVRTTDGGSTWLSSTMPNTANAGSTSSNRDICFISTSIGFVSGEDGVWKTNDGGSSWTNISPATIPPGSASMWFIDENVGIYAVGGGGGTIATFFRTTNGGSTWASVNDTSTTTDAAIGGATYTNGVFYVSGGGGKFWASTDSGATWTRSTTGSNGWQEDLVSYGSYLFIASADGSSSNSTGGGKVLVSTNGGSSWSISSFTTTIMWGVSMYSATEGWAAGDGGKAYQTVNGGSTWTDYSCGMNTNDRIDDIHFTDATHGWAVGDGIYKFVGNYYTGRPDTIDFGDILVGTTSADSSARLKSWGDGATVSQRSIGGLNAGQFGATGSLGSQTVAACGEAITPVHFSPTSLGVKTAYVAFVVAGVPDTIKVVLIGRGVQPQLDAPSTHPFDTIFCTTTGLDTFVVRNTGNYRLALNDSEFKNQTGGRFEIVSPTLPTVIMPGGSINLVLRALPTGTGTVTGTLTLFTNDPNNPTWDIQLNAYRRNIAIAFNQDTLLTIPSSFVYTDTSACITYRNIGDGTQTIGSVVPVSGDSAITALPLTNVFVSSGGVFPICFKVNARDTGWHVRRFRVRTLPCNRDTFVTVRFYARNPIIASLTTRTMRPAVCDEPSFDTITVRNDGNDTLRIDRPFFAGGDAVDFLLTSPSTWPVSVPPKGSMRVVVQLRALGLEGNRSTSLYFPNNDRFPGKSQWRVMIEGLRGISLIEPERRIVDIGEICINERRTSRVALINRGTAPSFALSFDPITTSPAVSVSSAPLGVSLDPGKADTASFLIAPAQVGPFSATYLLRYGPCDLTDTVIVRGRAVGVKLASMPAPIDFGSPRVGVKGDIIVTVTNTGDKPTTVRSMNIVPTVPGLTIVSPMPPFPLGPGESREVTLSMTPGKPGAFSATLVATADGSCADTLRTPITGIALQGPALVDRGTIRFGSLLSCEGTRRDSITITNTGTATLNITGIRLASGTASEFTIETSLGMPHPVAPGGSVTIVLAPKPGPPGTLLDSLLIEFASTDQTSISLPVTGRRDQVALDAFDAAGDTLRQLEFIALTSCNDSEERTIRLENSGSVPDTVYLSSTIGEMTVETGPTIIRPGEGRSITVRAAAATPGRVDGFLLIRTQPCGLIDSIPAGIVMRNVTASIDDRDFAMVNVGRDLTVDVPVVNSGDIDQTIDAVYVDPQPSDFSIVGSYAGLVIPAKGSLPIQVRFAPQTQGAAGARINVVTSAPCIDTLTADLTGSGVKSNIHIGARAIGYGARFACEDSCATFTIEGAGDDFVILTGATLDGPGASAYRMLGLDTPISIAPDSVIQVTVCFDPSALTTGSADAAITITTDDPVQPSIRIDLSGTRLPGLAAVPRITFGAPGDSMIFIHNRSSRPITVDASSITAPFTLETATPLTILPADSVPVLVRAGATGGSSGRLVLRHSLPCSDSVTIELSVASDQRYAVEARIGDTRGRWGKNVRVPIAFDNPDGAPVRSMTIAVKASPELLDPVAVHTTPASSSFTITPLGFNTTDGTYRFSVAAPAGTSFIPSSDSLLQIEYAVLRGGIISTPVEPVVTGLPANVTATTSEGEFVLEDYCDAYGRLLATSGNVTLTQNVPNPFNPETTIEFETAFLSHVTLDVFDVNGRLIERLIDEEMPAGRRRIVFNAKDLPSGTYTYRLITGLQVLTRRMIVTK